MPDRIVLPCISLWQPWGWAMLDPNGPHKDMENRIWHIKRRGPMLVHAAKGYGSRRDYESACEFISAIWDGPIPRLEAMFRGGIVGAWDLFDVVPPEQRKLEDVWHMDGQYGHRVRNAVPLPFRPLRGQQGLWPVELNAVERNALLAAGLLQIEQEQRP